MAPQWLGMASFLSIGLHVAADCSCVYQGTGLPSPVYSGTPHNSLTYIGLYGSMCAAWDAMPGTPNYDSCSNATDFSGELNWCQVPWCYVDESCEGRALSDVFEGTALYYSYRPCGGVDCYNNKTGDGCPYDPYGDSSYRSHKSGDCACLFHGTVLPEDTYNKYPTADPGKHKDLANIAIYGTTCAAWDMAPATPWVSLCPSGADWCAYDKNWCQAPWCYVDSDCSTKISSGIFTGSDAVQYSYATCVDTPDCYTNSGEDDRERLPPECPYDQTDNGWWTPGTCSEYTTIDVDSAGPGATAGAAGVLLLIAAFVRDA